MTDQTESAGRLLDQLQISGGSIEELTFMDILDSMAFAGLRFEEDTETVSQVYSDHIQMSLLEEEG